MPVRPLSPELAEKARLELNESPQRLEDDLRHLKEWIAKQPHLNARTDDQWLVSFLRGCKFSLERTKEKIDLFYSLRKLTPEMHAIKHKDPKFMEILSLGSLIVLPKTKNPADPRVMMMRPAAYDPAKYSMFDIMSVSGVIHKIQQLEDDNLMIAGSKFVLDLDGVTMGHFSQMTPTTMKKMVVLGQDASPFRMKGTHYLNTPTGFETIFNFIKNLLNEKNRSRLFVHNKNYEEFYQHVPKDILPAEYGGDAGTTADIIDYWKRKVIEYGPWLDEDEKYGSDESKRPGKPKTAEDLFGVEGSFRKLEVD